MLSKNWKLALVISLSATLLTACGSDKKQEEGKSNPVAGEWVNEQAMTQYEKKVVEAKDLNGFCSTAVSRSYRGYHGIKRDRTTGKYSFKINALSIKGNGEVSIFEVQASTGTQAGGIVNAAGLYVGNPANSAMLERVPAKASLQLDAAQKHLTVISLTSTQQPEYTATYVRSSKVKVSDYFTAVLQCLKFKNGDNEFDVDLNGWYKPVDQDDDLPAIQGPSSTKPPVDLSGGKDSDEDDPLGPPDLSDEELFGDEE